MDTRFTDQELAFQTEVRDSFANVFDDELLAMLEGAEASPRLKEGMIEYQRRLNARGWMAPGWPVEYGGESIQMHGGMGMTEEHPVGSYVKRLMIANILFGDADHHQQRFAELVNKTPTHESAVEAA